MAVDHLRSDVLPFFGKDDFLSNFYRCNLVIEGEHFNCVEQYYVATKAKFGRDWKLRFEVMQETDPARMKRMGRYVKNFCADSWDRQKVSVMIVALNAKYRQNPDLRVLLLQTAPQRLVEASPYDGFWGALMAKDDVDIGCPEKWRGKNILGGLLMDLRMQLLSEDRSELRDGGNPHPRVLSAAQGEVDPLRGVRHPCGVQRRYSRRRICSHQLRSLPGGLVRETTRIMSALVEREIFDYRNPLYLYR